MAPEGIEPPPAALEAARLPLSYGAAIKLLRKNHYKLYGQCKLSKKQLSYLYHLPRTKRDKVYKQNYRELNMGRKRADGTSSAVNDGKDTLEEKLLGNLIVLQKVNTDLAEKFDKLSNQIGDLLKLFEMAARSFAEHPAVLASEKDKEFLDKIDKLLDQNKTIAKGLTIVEEKIKERVYGQPSQSPNAQSIDSSIPTTPSMKTEEETEELFKFTPSGGKPLPKF